MFPSSERTVANRDKKMEDQQINCCISGPSSAERHYLGCLASGGGRGCDSSVQLIRSEFTSSVGISSLYPPPSEHRVRAGKAGAMVAPHQQNHTEAEGEGEGVGYDGWN